MFICNNLLAQAVLPSNYLKKNFSTGFKNAKSKQLNCFFPTIGKCKGYFELSEMKIFQNNIISYNDSLSNVALYSEIANDFFGPVRVSVGLTLAYPKSDSDPTEQQQFNRESFIQKFATGGGTMGFNFILPVYAFWSKDFDFNVLFGPRFSLDPPSFGVTSGAVAFNTSIFGTEVQTEVRGIKDIIRFYGDARLGYIAGNSAFYDAIQLKGKDRGGFWLNNYTFGVKIKDIFTLSYTKYWGSENIAERLSGYLTFTVAPE
jgi:hypothetical protein